MPKEDSPNQEFFSAKIRALEQRVEDLREQSQHDQRNEDLVSSTVIAELQTSLEELHVAEEELRQQNDELVLSRQTLEAERQRYRDLFERAPDGYVVTDKRGTIREANRVAARLLGVAQQALVGK